MGLRLFFFPNFPGAMFIEGATFIPDSRVGPMNPPKQEILVANITLLTRLSNDNKVY